MTGNEAERLLLERVRHAERASWGVDPDGTAYLDVADRIERARAAYRALAGGDDRPCALPDDRRPAFAGAGAELL